MDGVDEDVWVRKVAPEPPPSPSPSLRGGLFGAVVALLSMAPSVGYVLDLAGSGVPVERLALSFAAIVVGTGAALGACLPLAVRAADRASGARGWALAPALAATAAMVSAAPGALGTWLFGSLTLPYLGNGAVFAIPAALGVGVAIGTGWVDAPGMRATALARSAALAAAIFAPFGLAFALFVAWVPDEAALEAGRDVPLAPLGAVLAGALGGLFGACAAAVVAARRALERRAAQAA